MSAKGYWLAFIIGVSAGSAVALLYAPQSGTRTRKRLKRSLEDAGDYFGDASGYLRNQAEKLSGDAQSAIKRGRSYVGDAADSVSDFASGAVKQAKSMI